MRRPITREDRGLADRETDAHVRAVTPVLHVPGGGLLVAGSVVAPGADRTGARPPAVRAALGRDDAFVAAERSGLEILRRERKQPGHDVVLDVEARARRLWEPSKTTFKALEAVARRFPPHVHTYEITRHGRAGDQGTRYQLLPAGSVTPELRTLSDKLPLFDLEAESWGESRRPDDDTSHAPLPF